MSKKTRGKTFFTMPKDMKPQDVVVITLSMVAYALQQLWQMPSELATEIVRQEYGKVTGDEGPLYVDALLGRCMRLVEREMGPYTTLAFEELRLKRRKFVNEVKEKGDDAHAYEDRMPDSRLPLMAAAVAAGVYEPLPTPAMLKLWDRSGADEELPQEKLRMMLMLAAGMLIAAVERIDRAEIKAGNCPCCGRPVKDCEEAQGRLGAVAAVIRREV